MHIQLTILLRQGIFLLLWNACDFISQSESIVQAFFPSLSLFFRKHLIHLMCLEVAIGEDETTDGV